MFGIDIPAWLNVKSGTQYGRIFAFGRAVGRQTGCKPVALIGNVGSIPTRGTDRV